MGDRAAGTRWLANRRGIMEAVQQRGRESGNEGIRGAALVEESPGRSVVGSVHGIRLLEVGLQISSLILVK